MRDRARIEHERRIVGKLWSEYHYNIGHYMLGGKANQAQADSIGHPFAMVDLDSLEYCRRCRNPVAIFELKHANEASKIWTQTEKVAKAAGLQRYLVVVHTEGEDDAQEISGFQIYKPGWPQNPDVVSPYQLAIWLANIYREHHASDCAAMKTHLSAIDRAIEHIRRALGKAA